MSGFECRDAHIRIWVYRDYIQAQADILLRGEIMGYSKADDFMIKFVTQSKDILKDYDKRIYDNLKKSKHVDFYKDEWKGLGISGITESVVRFLIFTGLCNQYAIWPERRYDDGSKCRADLAIYSDPNKDLPDITVEIKWGGILKSKQLGSFSQGAIKDLEKDFKKLIHRSRSPNNYVLQIAFAPKSIILKKNALQRQIDNEISEHITRFYKVKLLPLESFQTCKTDSADKDLNCWLICWKIHK